MDKSLNEKIDHMSEEHGKIYKSIVGLKEMKQKVMQYKISPKKLNELIKLVESYDSVLDMYHLCCTKMMETFVKAEKLSFDSLYSIKHVAEINHNALLDMINKFNKLAELAKENPEEALRRLDIMSNQLREGINVTKEEAN